MYAKEGSLNLVNRRFGCGSRKGISFFFFFFLYGGKFVCFEFDRPLGIVEILRVILGVSSFDLFLVNLDNLYE